MTSDANLPTIPVDVASLPLLLLSADERASSKGGDVDPFDWFCAAGRLLRSPFLFSSPRAAVRKACGFAASESSLPVLRARIDIELHQFASSLRSIVPDRLSGGRAWSLVSNRDDLESVAVSVGVAWRSLESVCSHPLDEHFFALERFLTQQLEPLDAEMDSAALSLLDALRAAPRDPLRERISALNISDLTAGVWLALVERVTTVPEALPVGDRVPPEAESTPQVPWLSISRHLTGGRPLATATGKRDVLQALQEADRDPVAKLAEDRILVRVRRPLDPLAPVSETMTGLAIESEPPSLLVNAWAEGATLVVQSIAVADGVRWLPLAPLAATPRWRLNFETSEGKTLLLNLVLEKG